MERLCILFERFWLWQRFRVIRIWSKSFARLTLTLFISGRYYCSNYSCVRSGPPVNQDVYYGWGFYWILFILFILPLYLSATYLRSKSQLDPLNWELDTMFDIVKFPAPLSTCSPRYLHFFSWHQLPNININNWNFQQYINFCHPNILTFWALSLDSGHNVIFYLWYEILSWQGKWRIIWSNKLPKRWVAKSEARNSDLSPSEWIMIQLPME